MADKRPPPHPGNEDWDPYASQTWERGTPFEKPPNQPHSTAPEQSPWQSRPFGDRWRGAAFATPAAPPQTYLVPSILVTLFCFLPTGIAAIVFAAKAGSSTTVGDFQGAADASRKARMLVLVSVGIGLLFWLTMIIVGVASSGSSAYGQPPAP
ncbi:CD225/dispanin family protein [Streptomyces griseorubiginosus]|uniref:CD225/dispanin family protein n=1 Tax=Streptomyces griseorubiginosus TaxID=67304 RepID=UPI001AD62B64|nr:CD225/dispanin family protein [Streptomyces griseorubiginosus]MBO4257511.1 hypothetical protein [Streptomyces griseorubiginosus]